MNTEQSVIVILVSVIWAVVVTYTALILWPLFFIFSFVVGWITSATIKVLPSLKLVAGFGFSTVLIVLAFLALLGDEFSTGVWGYLVILVGIAHLVAFYLGVFGSAWKRNKSAHT